MPILSKYFWTIINRENLKTTKMLRIVSSINCPYSSKLLIDKLLQELLPINDKFGIMLQCYSNFLESCWNILSTSHSGKIYVRAHICYQFCHGIIIPFYSNCFWVVKIFWPHHIPERFNGSDKVFVINFWNY